MSNSLNPVFGEWYTDKQLGTGTDGKVFKIYKVKPGGEKEYSVLKIIRFSENRNERIISLSNVDEKTKSQKENDKFTGIIKDIKRNINTVRKLDGGKRFVKYEDIEIRNSSDKKEKLILIRMEEMRSLSQLLEEFSFTLEETLRMGISVCRGLMKCREFNYIYPNLKPENILFDRNGICKLGDFGSFSCLEPSKTAVAYKRTQYYMAPEFIKTGNINSTVDTYSLGLILYMLVNRGRLPFTEPYPQKLTINSLNEATAKRASGAKLTKPELCSEELWSVINKACSHRARDRYFTPEAMLNDLKSVLNNKPSEISKFNDNYVKRDESKDSGEEILVPDLEETHTAGKNSLFSPVFDIKEKIQIPVSVPYYNKRPKPQTTSRPVKYEMPQVKKTSKKDFEGIKRLIIFALLTLLLFILFIAGAVIRFGGNDGEQIVTLFCSAAEFYFQNLTLLM